MHTEESAEEAVTKYIQLVREFNDTNSAITMCSGMSSPRMNMMDRLRRRLQHKLDQMTDLVAEMTELLP